MSKMINTNFVALFLGVFLLAFSLIADASLNCPTNCASGGCWNRQPGACAGTSSGCSGSSDCSSACECKQAVGSGQTCGCSNKPK